MATNGIVEIIRTARMKENPANGNICFEDGTIRAKWRSPICTVDRSQ
jgi:hypothetical protein